MEYYLARFHCPLLHSLVAAAGEHETTVRGCTDGADFVSVARKRAYQLRTAHHITTRYVYSRACNIALTHKKDREGEPECERCAQTNNNPRSYVQ